MEDTDDLKKTLEENAKEYYKNALETEKKGHFNSSSTLFFKCISALSDLYILLKENIFPSSHNERFRILELKHKEIYFILDKDFSYYQDSYRSKLTKEISEVLKKDAERIAKLLGIRL